MSFSDNVKDLITDIKMSDEVLKIRLSLMKGVDPNFDKKF